MFDIDIDFRDRNEILNIIPCINALRVDLSKHPTGVYVQPIPHDPITNTATIDYKEAERRGYFKIDFLNVGLYKGIRDEAHLNALLNQEPLWELLLEESIVSQLFHLNGHLDILRKNPPTSVAQLAAVLGMIRPGKRYLIGKDWETIFQNIWTKSENGQYVFKKSHAHGYAIAIIVQLNLICEQLELSSSFADLD